MRPDVDDATVAVLRQSVPELEPRYQRLVADYGDELMPFLVFTELADLVLDNIWLGTDASEEVVQRSCDAIEAVAASDWPDRGELVGYGFLDSLNPHILDQVWPMLGDRTREVMAAVESGALDPDSELEDGDD